MNCLPFMNKKVHYRVHNSPPLLWAKCIESTSNFFMFHRNITYSIPQSPTWQLALKVTIRPGAHWDSGGRWAGQSRAGRPSTGNTAWHSVSAYWDASGRRTGRRSTGNTAWQCERTMRGSFLQSCEVSNGWIHRSKFRVRFRWRNGHTDVIVSHFKTAEVGMKKRKKSRWVRFDVGILW
jgi:YD repeat-containing protein